LASVIASDAGPLIAFARLDSLKILTSLFEEVWAPAEVAEECSQDLSLPGARTIRESLDRGLLHVSDPVAVEPPFPPGLGAGERAAIVLALQKQCPLLIDDRLGRHAARRAGVAVVGTGAVLLRAKDQELIERVQPSLDRLRRDNYRLSQALVDEILRRAGEGPGRR